MSHVATIKTQVPNLATFTVRGTVPLPQGYSYLYSADCPFTVVDPAGNDLVTQWDVVSRYPNGDLEIVAGTGAEQAALDVIQVYTSGNDPLSFLMAEGNDQLDSRAHLLAVLQNL